MDYHELCPTKNTPRQNKCWISSEVAVDLRACV